MERTAQLARKNKDACGEGDGKPATLVQAMYALRSYVVHEAAVQLLTGADPTQILLLGAGLDTSFATERYRDLGVTRIFAVDLPSMIRQRQEIKQKEPDEAVPVEEVECDLNSDNLKERLVAHGFSLEQRTVVVLEMVLGYLSEEVVKTSILPFLASLPAYLVSYDVTLDPATSLGAQLLGEFAKRNAPLRCVRPSRKEHMELFLNAGFRRPTACYSMNEAIDVFGLAPASSPMPTPSPHFDEYASLAVMHNLYHLSLASSLCVPPGPHPPPQPLEIRPALDCDLKPARALYLAAFAAPAALYASVRKFTTKAAKRLRPERLLVAVEEGEVVGAVSITSLQPQQQQPSSSFADRGGETEMSCEVPPASSSDAEAEAETEAGEETGVELSHLCVADSRRREGLGLKLIKAALAQAPPCSVVHLSVLADQTDAQRLYLRLGFVEEGRTDCGGGCVVVHMKLRPSPHPPVKRQEAET